MFSINIGTGAFSSGNKPGAFSADNLSICKGLMAWTERETDPRWQNRNYSVIRIYDFKTGEIRRLTSKSRYFSPSISPDGSKLLAVKVSIESVSSLVLLDLQTGDELETLMSSPTDVHINPVWSSDGDHFIYMQLSKNGKGIYQYSISDRVNTCMLEPSFAEISNPTYAGKYILFNGPYSGIENVYSIDTTTKNLYKVTSAPFGACNADFNPSLGKIVYSDYNSLGYRIVEADFDPAQWTPVSNVSDNSIGLYKDLIKDETGLLDSLSVPTKVYESKPYRKSSHLFSFHSWAPVYFNYPLSETGAGLSFMSQNDLSTATTILGYDWDFSGNTGQFKASFNYAGWYPVLDLDLAAGARSITYEPEGHAKHRYTWNEGKISGGISLPLLFSKSKYYTGIQLKAHATMQHASNSTAPDTLSFYREGWVSTLDYRILWYHYMKQAQKDVYPRFGQSIDLNYRFSPFGSRSYGSIASSEISLFLPGLFKHHGTRFYAGYQSKVNKDFAYSDLVNVARGYPVYRHEKMLSFAMNYKFPFAYPDVKLGPVAYIKRLKANLFYDHTNLYYEGKWYLRNSFGTEVTADMHVFRFILPLDSGIRVGYLLNDNSWFVNLLFSVNLSI
ncbi:MAG: PD40 domain-containing protein [Bacteroidales bacterium]|nr:PD40 domain-containing protein [Bacteroidales bacterium]